MSDVANAELGAVLHPNTPKAGVSGTPVLDPNTPKAGVSGAPVLDPNTPKAGVSGTPVEVLQPELMSLDGFRSLEVDWIWRPYLPCGMLTMLSGDPGSGKTYVALAIAAEMTRGKVSEFQGFKVSKGEVSDVSEVSKTGVSGFCGRNSPAEARR